MSHAIRVAIVDPGYRTRESLKQSLQHCAHLQLELECTEYQSAAERIRATQPDVVLLDLDADSLRAIELITNLSDGFPIPIVATSHQAHGPTIMQAIRAGAKELLTIPAIAAEMIAVLERASDWDAKREKPPEPCDGQVIAIWGSTGGVGSSTLAVNLAAAMAEEAEPSLGLIDLDLAMGDLDVLLDLIPERTIMDLIRTTSEWDATLLRRCFVQLDSGIHLLPHPVHLDEITEVHEDFVKRLLVMSRSLFRYTMVDLSKTFNAVDQAVLREADSILLVTQLDLPCLRNVVRILLSLKDRHLDSKVKVIVNRFGFSSGQIGIKRAEATLGREIFWQVPNDFATMVTARNNGIPLVRQAPQSAIAGAYRELARKLGGQIESSSVVEKPRWRWLGLIPSRS